MPQSQWIFPQEAVMNTPSIQSGMSPTQERELRAKACNFITLVGIKLKLPQLTIATASIFLHRFYMRVPIQHHHHYDTAATALFLATKVEENMRRYENLITECIRYAQKNPNHPPVDRNSSEFWKWSDVIQEKEEIMLEALCFDLNIPQSYNFLLEYSRKLGIETKEIIRSAWSLLNDSHLSVLCLLYRPEAIAAAALSLAVEKSDKKLEDGWTGTLGVTDKELRGSKKWLLAIYENNALRPPGPEDIPESPLPTPEHRSSAQSTPAHKRTYDETKETTMNGNGAAKRPRVECTERNGTTSSTPAKDIQQRIKEVTLTPERDRDRGGGMQKESSGVGVSEEDEGEIKEEGDLSEGEVA